MQRIDMNDKDSILSAVFTTPDKMVLANGSCQIHFSSFDLASDAIYYLKNLKNLSPTLDDLQAIEDKDHSFYIEMTNDQYTSIKKELRKNAKKIGPQGDFALKALRGDTRCYYRNFVEMVASPINIKHPLRRGEKKLYTTTGKGLFKRKEFFDKDDKFIKKPTYSPSMKEGFSKAQSTSLGLSNYFPNVFGFGSRGEKLLGAIVDENDILYSDRLYIYDGGTIYRPYDLISIDKGREYYQSKVKGDEKVLYSKDELAEFKQAISDPKNSSLYNEAMVYMRWNIKTSVLFIASDNLHTRLLTQDYARILKTYLLKNNLCDENYIVPICYYDPKNPNMHLREYTIAEQKLDLLESKGRCNDPHLCQQEFAEEQYEILLSLSGDEILKIVQEEFNGKMLLIDILANGYIHIFQSLRDKTDPEILMKILSQSIQDEKYRSLLPDIIYHCFRTKENDLANFIYKETQFDKLTFNIDPKNNHLIKAVLDNSPECIEKLLTNKSYLSLINARTPHSKGALESNHTPFSLACGLGQHQSAAKLLEYKELDVNLLDENKLTPLQMAIINGNFETAKVILKCDTHQVDVNNVTLNGNTALGIAVQTGHHLIMRELLKYAVDRRAKTPGEFNSLLMLLGASESMSYGNSVLHLAVKNRHVDIIKELLTHKEIDINHKNAKGYTPLMLAVKNGDLEIVKLLLKYKNIDINYSFGKYHGIKYDKNGALNYYQYKYKKSALYYAYFLDKPLKYIMLSLLLPKIAIDLTDPLHNDALKTLLENSKNHNLGIKLLTDSLNDYISARDLGPEMTFGSLFGLTKEKKINAAKFLLKHLYAGTMQEIQNDKNYPQYKDALLQGNLSNIYSLAQIQSKQKVAKIAPSKNVKK